MKTKNIWSAKTPSAADVGAFIKASPKEAQIKLKEMRTLIKTMVPQAEETISYKMPVYKVNGKGLVGFAGFKKHIGFYPMSGTFLEMFKKELEHYKSSKGAVQFPLDKPLPIALIKKIIKARIQENKKISV